MEERDRRTINPYDLNDVDRQAKRMPQSTEKTPERRDPYALTPSRTSKVGLRPERTPFGKK